jgi:malonyl-CoA/methylmalonyl-CoA synthetase
MAGVEESAVIGLPHPDFGEAGLAIVVVEESSMDLDSIRTELKGVLANYKVPKLVVRADTLPRNAMGKVQKNVLREQYRSVWKESLDQ